MLAFTFAEGPLKNAGSEFGKKSGDWMDAESGRRRNPSRGTMAEFTQGK